MRKLLVAMALCGLTALAAPSAQARPINANSWDIHAAPVVTDVQYASPHERRMWREEQRRREVRREMRREREIRRERQVRREIRQAHRERAARHGYYR